MPAWFVAALLMVAAGTAPPVQAQSLAPSPGAQQYVEKAAIGNRFEIESSHLARSSRLLKNPLVYRVAE